jgi:hypothetical protein
VVKLNHYDGTENDCVRWPAGSEDLYVVGQPKLVLPSSANGVESSGKTRYAFQAYEPSLQASISFGPIAASAILSTYIYSGGEKWDGPLHEALYIFDPSAKDSRGKPLPSRKFKYPACKEKLWNYFSGTKQVYDVTVTGEIEVCFFICFSVVNGWLIPFGVDR